MPRNARKVHNVCRRCKTRFTGDYCPYCGAEKGGPATLRSRGGLISGFLRFLLSLLVLAIILLVTFIVLDYVASAQGDRQGAARAILDSARYAIPQSVLDYYAGLKIQFLDSWIAAIKDFFVTVFG